MMTTINTLNEGESIILTLPNGWSKVVSYKELTTLLKISAKAMRTPLDKELASLRKSKGMYEFAVSKGKFTNGAVASLDRLERMRVKMYARVLELPEELREEFYG